MDIKTRCKAFIATLDLPISRFCKNIGISTTAYYRWQNDDLRLSETTQVRIENYIERFGY